MPDTPGYPAPLGKRMPSERYASTMQPPSTKAVAAPESYYAPLSARNSWEGGGGYKYVLDGQNIIVTKPNGGEVIVRPGQLNSNGVDVHAVIMAEKYALDTGGTYIPPTTAAKPSPMPSEVSSVPSMRASAPMEPEEPSSPAPERPEHPMMAAKGTGLTEPMLRAVEAGMRHAASNLADSWGTYSPDLYMSVDAQERLGRIPEATAKSFRNAADAVRNSPAAEALRASNRPAVEGFSEESGRAIPSAEGAVDNFQAVAGRAVEAVRESNRPAVEGFSEESGKAIPSVRGGAEEEQGSAVDDYLARNTRPDTRGALRPDLRRAVDAGMAAHTLSPEGKALVERLDAEGASAVQDFTTYFENASPEEKEILAREFAKFRKRTPSKGGHVVGARSS